MAMNLGEELRARRSPTEGRTQPNRYAAGYFRHPASRDPKTPTVGEREPGQPGVKAGTPMSSPEDVVVYAVRLGYKVAEEQVRKSRNAARRLRAASIASGSGDVGEVLAHGLRLYRQMAEMLVEVAETLGTSSRIWSHLFAKYRGQSRPSPRTAPRQDLDASLGRIADTLAGKVSETIDAPAGEEELYRTLARVAGEFRPALSALSSSVRSSAPADSPGNVRAPVFIGCPQGIVASAALTLQRAGATALACEGLIGKGTRGKPVVLAADVSFTRTGGVWKATVRISESRANIQGTFRGVVCEGDEQVGWLEITLLSERRPGEP
jgi:hypothetical protein